MTAAGDSSRNPVREHLRPLGIRKETGGIAITGQGATTLPAKGIARNCLIHPLSRQAEATTPGNSGRLGEGNAQRQPRHEQRRWLPQIIHRLIVSFRFGLADRLPVAIVDRCLSRHRPASKRAKSRAKNRGTPTFSKILTCVFCTH